MNQVKKLIPLGALVRVKVDLSCHNTEVVELDIAGMCKLYVVGHLAADSSGTPLYMVSDLPVVYPVEMAAHSWPRTLYHSLAALVDYFYEHDVQTTEQHQTLHPTIDAWFQSHHQGTK